MAYPKGKPFSEEHRANISKGLRKIPSRNCEFCGVLIEKPRKNQQYCSRECRSRAPRTGKIRYECLRCGAEFWRYPSQGGKYCSFSCEGKSRVGPLSSQWKGGRIMRQGYVMLRQAGGKYKFEHRIVMEQILGRPMEPHETVHHKNGIRDDNRPENLEFRVGKHGKGATHHCPTCTCEA
jgi:hypothetical protein